MDKDTAKEIAKEAVKGLVEAKGVNFAFPFDLLWNYGKGQEVPSLQRPAQARMLINAGYIERTGQVVKASSGPRAGSPTTEYRPGKKFQPQAPVPVPATPMTIAEALKKLDDVASEYGFVTTPEQIPNFYLALVTSPLVILAGPSGTGKSWLPRLFAGLVGAQFTPVPVQPQWADNADLLGYTSTLSPEVYFTGRLTTALAKAGSEEKKHVPFLILLDEMNLAFVEHYFSDFLSVVETRRRDPKTKVVTTDVLPLDLPPAGGEKDAYSHLRDLRLPPNVMIVGTANLDESTRTFSPKVLDRAISIEFGVENLTMFSASPSPPAVVASDFKCISERLVDTTAPVSVTEAYHGFESLFDGVAGLLEEIRAILEKARIPLGYRTRDSICMYMWHWLNDELEEILPASAAIDLCIMQKVLPRISGTGVVLEGALAELQSWLEREDGKATKENVGEKAAYPRSANKVARMRLRLQDESATTFWDS